MSAVEKPQIPDEENYYKILEVPSTANLTEIRNAYEEKLEEAHLEAIAAYSLFPEEETEEKLLHYSQAFVALANPIARAKYDDEIHYNKVSTPEEKTNVEVEEITKNPKKAIEKYTLKIKKTMIKLLTMLKLLKVLQRKLLDKLKKKGRTFTLISLRKMNYQKIAWKSITLN